MVELTRPRIEMLVELDDGRHLGVAEYGPAGGRPVVWFHGTPGGRRQIPDSLRRAAHDQDIRLVVVERPGYGSSTPHHYDEIRAVTTDVTVLLDALEIDRFGVAGLSGGGPYALAVAHDFPDRVVAVAVLGGVAPHVGPEALEGEGGWVSTLARLGPLTGPLSRPFGSLMGGLVWAMRPFASPVMELTARMFPPGDRAVLTHPEFKVMFLDDMIRTARGGLPGPALDLRLFVRDWGFRVADIAVPVHFWQGDADPVVTLAQARNMAGLVRGATFVLRPEESHLGGLAVADEAVAKVMDHWSEVP